MSAPKSQTPPKFDFGKLAAKPAEIEGVARTSKLDAAPGVLAAVRESYESKSAREFTVPNHAAKDVAYLVRAAAAKLNHGVRIVVKPAGADASSVTFLAKDRKRKLTEAERAERDAAKAERDAAKAKAAKVGK